MIDSPKSYKYKVAMRYILDNIVWVIFFILLLSFSLGIRGFFTKDNYINIIYHSVFIGILAIAETYVLISGNLDLSIESVAACSAIMSVWLTSTSKYASGVLAPTWIGLIVVIAIGALIGLYNAFFVIKLQIDAFLVTLSSYIFVRAVAIWVTGGYGMSGLPESFRFIDKTKVLDIPLMVFMMLIMYIIFEFLLKRSRFGRHIYIVGGNENAARNFGINVNNLLYKVFILSGIVSALAGWLMAARANGAVASMGRNYLFEALTAVVIGGVSLTGGEGSLIGVFAGSLILSSIHSALNITAMSPFITNTIQGFLIIIAVSLDSLKKMFK